MITTQLTGQIGSIPVEVRSIDTSGCTIEHQKQIRVSADSSLKFRLAGTTEVATVRAVRSRIAPRAGDGIGYLTTLQFVELPESLENLLTSGRAARNTTEAFST